MMSTVLAQTIPKVIMAAHEATTDALNVTGVSACPLNIVPIIALTARTVNKITIKLIASGLMIFTSV